MKCSKLLGIIFAMVWLWAPRANAQDVETLYEAIVQLETSLNQFIAVEAGQHQAHLRTLRSDVTALESMVQAQDQPPTRNAQDEALRASPKPFDASQSDLRARLAQLEQRLAEAIQPGSNAPSVSSEYLTDQVGAVLAELKTYVEQNRQNEADTPAATPFSITGQLRHRSEVDARRGSVDSEAPRFHLLRTRLNMSFQPIDDVNVFVQVQDSRTFGGEDPSKGRGTLDGSADALDFHQAYFAVTDLFGTPLKLKLGRQELAYANQRLVGSVGWSNIGRTFDAGVVSYRTGKVSVDLFTSKLIGSPTSAVSQNLHGVYSNFRFAGSHQVDAFVLIDNNTEKVLQGVDAGKSKLVRYTGGAYLRGKLASFDYEVEGAYQAGKTMLTDSEARASIGAYLVSGSMGYTLNKENNLRIGVLYTRLSGDDDPGDATARTFNTLFATNHKFYGYLDYFPKTFSASGLQDLALSVGVNPTPALGLKLDLHRFASEQGISVTDAFGDTVEHRVLGQEVDLTAKYKYNKSFSIIGGGSLFLADEVMQTAIGRETAYKIYLMTVVNF